MPQITESQLKSVMLFLSINPNGSNTLALYTGIVPFSINCSSVTTLLPRLTVNALFAKEYRVYPGLGVFTRILVVLIILLNVADLKSIISESFI